MISLWPGLNNVMMMISLLLMDVSLVLTLVRWSVPSVLWDDVLNAFQDTRMIASHNLAI